MDDTTRQEGSKELSESARMGFLAATEQVAALILRNRFIWLVLSLALVVCIQLSLVQANTQRFDTMELVAIILLIIEVAMAFCIFLIHVSIPKIMLAWESRFRISQLGAPAFIFANLVVAAALLAILLLPMLFLHRYPELVAENIRIPLTFLQRATLIFLVLLSSANVMMIFRAYFRFPFWLSGLLGLAWQCALGYFITSISLGNDSYSRLNDVFFYNQLWKYTDLVPNLQRGELFHKIEMPYFGYYFFAGFIIWLATLLLVLPRGARAFGK